MVGQPSTSLQAKAGSVNAFSILHKLASEHTGALESVLCVQRMFLRFPEVQWTFATC